MTLWWLSFADGDRPEGQQFLGAVIVEAKSFFEAHAITHIIRVNPGGELMGWPVPPEHNDKIPTNYRNRLLSKADILVLDPAAATLGEIEDEEVD